MMHNVEDMPQEKAYDIVRREFYALRQEEDVERRIAKEEAMKLGAYFGKSFNQVGMELEDQQYENWKKWAGKQIQSVQAEQDAAYSNFGATEEASAEGREVDVEDTDADMDTSSTASTDAAPRR
jgi:small subunit ribosomal protein S23